MHKKSIRVIWSLHATIENVTRKHILQQRERVRKDRQTAVHQYTHSVMLVQERFDRENLFFIHINVWCNCDCTVNIYDNQPSSMFII